MPIRYKLCSINRCCCCCYCCCIKDCSNTLHRPQQERMENSIPVSFVATSTTFVSHFPPKRTVRFKHAQVTQAAGVVPFCRYHLVGRRGACLAEYQLMWMVKRKTNELYRIKWFVFVVAISIEFKRLEVWKVRGLHFRWLVFLVGLRNKSFSVICGRRNCKNWIEKKFSFTDFKNFDLNYGNFGGTRNVFQRVLVHD